MMLEFIFGEAAGAAWQGASERLMLWSGAFEEWMAERQHKYKKDAVKQARLAWRRLLRERRKMPWELSRADIEAHAAWMQAQGYATSSIANSIGFFDHFFRWRQEQGIEAEMANPAAEVQRPKVRRYEGAKLLSRGEVERLLGLMERDPSPLGKRDYAFFLFRMKMGVPLKVLLRLQWKDFYILSNLAPAELNLKDEDGFGAIKEYLEASGRLAGMQPDSYIFAPLREPGKEDTGTRREDWREEQHIASRTILASLKLYGKAAGIAEEKLNLMTLRRTAMRLRLEEGDDVEEMRAFLDSHEERKSTKYRLGKLPGLPVDGETADRERVEDMKLPERKAKPFKDGEGIIHGLYAKSQPPEAVAAILKEGIQGIEEALVGMRLLERGLFERFGKAKDNQEAARLANAYTLAGFRLAEMIKVEKELAKEEDDDRLAKQFADLKIEEAIEIGEEPIEEPVQQEAMGEEADLSVNDRRMNEEIAGARHVLRQTLERAVQAEETDVFMKLVESYNLGCKRLLKLLRAEKAGQGQFKETIAEAVDQVLTQLRREGFM